MLGFLTGMLAVIVGGFLFLKILPMIAVLFMFCVGYSIIEKYVNRAFQTIGVK